MSGAAALAAVAEAPQTRRVVFRAHDYQLAAFTSNKPIIFCGCGVGSGKTATGAIWTLLRCKESPPGVLGLVTANTYPQLFDATLRRLYETLDEFGVPHWPVTLPRSYAPISIEIWNGSRRVQILCRSLDRYENLAGPETGWGWSDELHQTQRAALDIVIARSRDKRMPRNQTLLTTTLDDPTSWMYDLFVSKFDAENMLVLNAPTYVNESNLGEGYIDRVLRPMYSEKMFQRMVEAKWVSIEGTVIYYAFARGEGGNVTSEADYDPALPILWTHDFNIGQGKPMSSCLAQIKKGPGPAGADGKPTIRPELHVFDELILDTSDTNDAIDEFKGRLEKLSGKPTVRIYGDRSGKSKDTRSKATDYELISRAGFNDQRVPEANPPIRDRHNSVNALLKNAAGDVRLKIHPRCKTLIKGLETVKLRGGAQYLEEETREQHVTTALGYLVVAEFPIISRGQADVFYLR